MENSPYLSDEVLLAYIASNPPSGHLKQIMIANSQLSDQVKLALQASNIPVGTMNQIANVKKGFSGRTILYFEINQLKAEFEGLYNDIIRDALLNEDENATYDELVTILKQFEDQTRLKLLLSTYIVKKRFSIGRRDEK